MKSWSVQSLRWSLAVLVLGATLAAAQRVSADPSYSTVILNDGPLGYWRLDEADGTMALDSSGHGYDGTYRGGVMLDMPGAIAGDPDTAAAFDARTGYVAIAGRPFNLLNGFTLEAWVINNNTEAIGRILANGEPGVCGYSFGVLPDGTLRLATYGVLDSGVVVPTDGSYHYVAVTFDADNSASFYLDGTWQQTLSGPSPARNSPFQLNIGRNPAGRSLEYWNGTIDEAAIYNYVLTADQITAHYLAGIVSRI